MASLLDLVLSVLQGMGGVGLLLAAYLFWVRRTPPQRRRAKGIAGISAIALVVAVGLGAILRSRTATDEVSTRQRYASARGLALELTAPPGWHLEHDPASWRLSAVEGDGPKAEAAAIFTVQSSPSAPEDPDVELTSLLSLIQREHERMGLTVAEVREEMVTGVPARSFISTAQVAQMWLALIRRGPRFRATVQCTVRDDRDPRTACSTPLAALKWKKPRHAPADF